MWQCNGPCINNPPYFGVVKRAMNRPPGPSDSWYERHRDSCGGTWTKISEPVKTSKKGEQMNKIDGWVKKKPGLISETSSSTSGGSAPDVGSGVLVRKRPPDGEDNGKIGKLKRERLEENECEKREEVVALVQCPVCEGKVAGDVNTHLDTVHGFS